MIIDLKQGSREWLEFRKTKFNASETPDVLGIGFNKPYKLALIKSGDELVYKNYAMKLGNENEPKIREHLNAKYELNLKPVVMLSDEDDRFLASLDGVDFDKNVFCEIKFSTKESEYVKKHGKPTEKYYYQIQHQFYVANLETCIFAVGAINENFEYEIIDIEVKRDNEAINKLKNAWIEFEKNYMSQSVDDEWLNLSEELHELSEKKKLLDEKIEELKKRAIEKANGKELKAYGLTIYQTSRKPTIDYKSFVESQKLEVPKEYVKDGSVTWSVRVAN
ncbi:YqaJ-like viral recombinase domain protein [Campylobacter hyointestinalis subsp. lawsonii CCUG 27631]|uniref:lambda-exonuclease family protein n=1 Tax=Campylobacter hyointestinalis TaxID=198 RepID=UPI0007C982AF|nr:YqaJ viral recombinase family protein [Campylobacter hyointestinalis]ANE34376.1 YqaJ-like viral recombinase domain protein [Campylobacter hyointestinalis subsp. lawsonii CCUG 27631]